MHQVHNTLTCLQILPELQDGGVERGTIEMAIFLKNQSINGVRIRPVVVSAGGKRVADLHGEGILHVTLPLMSKNPVTILCNAWRLYKLIRSEDVRLVHARSRAPAWSAYLASRLAHVPFMTTFHGTHGLKGVGKKLYNSVMVRGDAVVANSSFVRGHIEEHYQKYIHAPEIIVAARGVDVRVFRPNNLSDKEKVALRTSLKIHSDNIMVLLVGRLSRWKGQDMAIQALALEDLKGKNVVLVLAGGLDKAGSYLDELKMLAERLGVLKQVRFLGARSDVADLYNAADIALSASTKPEAFGRVAIEAMASGTPIVATAHGGSLETVKNNETGLLVLPNDAHALAGSIKILAENKTLRDAMGIAGVQHVRSHFSLEKMCEAEFAAYVQLLGENLHGKS